MARNSKHFLFTLVIVFLAVSLSGCTSLRKKFIRKPKGPQKSEEIVPLLEPVEYAPVTRSSREVYQMHYTMLQAYFSDLMQIIGRGENEKRERYLLAEMAVRLDLMAQELDDETLRQQLKEIAGQLAQMEKDLQQTSARRRYDRIRQDLGQLERTIRISFRPRLLQEALQD